jgi:uncharacterized membrane protein YqaE (UPF0057 family)
MLYFFAIVIPPLGVLLCGRPFAALLNVFLTLLFYLPGVVHALCVVSESKADSRARRYR